MDRATGRILREYDPELLKRDIALIPERFQEQAAALVDERIVPSPAFATWAQKVRRAPAAKKRKQKIADASRRRNRR